MLLLLQAHDRLEDSHLEPVSADNIELVKEVLEELENKRSKQAKELQKILSNPHFRVCIVLGLKKDVCFL